MSYQQPAAVDGSLSVSALCDRFAALGQFSQNLRRADTQSSTRMTGTIDVDMPNAGTNNVNNTGTPDPADNILDTDFYTTTRVPLPQAHPPEGSQPPTRWLGPEFRAHFRRKSRRLANGKIVFPCGVSMLECLQGTSQMIDGEERLEGSWGEKSAGKINVLISWPGYDAHSIAEISVYEPGTREKITRSELAKRIAMHYFMFFDYLTLNENRAENRAAYDEDGIGRDLLWRVGFRGYMFDRLSITSVSQTFENFCELEIKVMTAKGYPLTARYP